MKDAKEDPNKTGNGREGLDNNSEADNDRFHQLYDNYQNEKQNSEDMYKMYEQMNDTEEDKLEQQSDYSQIQQQMRQRAIELGEAGQPPPFPNVIDGMDFED